MFRYSGKAKCILESVLLDENNLANACEGCALDSIDDPHKEPSAHAGVKGSERVTDSRFDWQGQPMFRRLPYDRFGRLLVIFLHICQRIYLIEFFILIKIYFVLLTAWNYDQRYYRV